MYLVFGRKVEFLVVKECLFINVVGKWEEKCVGKRESCWRGE